MDRELPSDFLVNEAVALRVALTRVHRQLRIRIGSDLTASQASALARIEQASALRLTALAELEGISSATMNKVVDSLVQRGLIERVADPLDRRAHLLQLGSDGNDLLLEIRARNTESLRAAISALNDRERETIRETIPALEHLSELLHLDYAMQTNPTRTRE
ncbi:MAG TPA: MarR family transcriptional regulator [Acidimicrobiales bacterium]|nr:MarR family transcriptional regulator [Acidimicrobiales bacterium]